MTSEKAPPPAAPMHPAEHWDDVLDREMPNESDRASVILGAALLDEALATLLKARLVPNGGADDALFDGANAPIGTFSARIELALRLGVINTGFARSLHLIRRIRNDFAHNVAGCSFSDGAVVGRMTELRRQVRISERAAQFRSNFPAGTKGEFQMVVSWLQWLLRSEIETVEPLDTYGALEAEYPPDSPKAKAE